jgi:hypothetical protein
MHGNEVTDHPIRIPSAWRWGALTWLIQRILLSLWGAIISDLGPLPVQVGPDAMHGVEAIVDGWRGAWLGVWQRWDAIHYFRIAHLGYGPDERSAFFPLYPLLGRGVGRLLGDEFIGLLLVSNLAAIAAYALLYKLADEVDLPLSPRRALVGLALFPSAFFLLAAYPQSLLLLLALATGLAARRRRWGWVFLTGLLAGLTHSTGMALSLLVVAFAGWPLKRKAWRVYLAATGPMLGVLAFVLWRGWQGYPPLTELLGGVWGRQPLLVWLLAGGSSEFIGWALWLTRNWSSVLALGLALGALVWGWRRLSRSNWLYLCALTAFLVMSGTRYEPLSGLARYMLAGFPLWLAAGVWLERKGVRLAWTAVGVGGQMLLSALFFVWGFVG